MSFYLTTGDSPVTIETKHPDHHIIVKNFDKNGQQIAHLDMKDNSGNWKFRAAGVTMSYNSFNDEYVLSSDGDKIKKTKKISGDTYTKYTSAEAKDWLIAARPNQKARMAFWYNASQFLANHGFADLQETGLKMKESLKY